MECTIHRRLHSRARTMLQNDKRVVQTAKHERIRRIMADEHDQHTQRTQVAKLPAQARILTKSTNDARLTERYAARQRILRPRTPQGNLTVGQV